MLHSQSKGNSNKFILFFHGNSQSHETWDEVVSQEVLNKYTLKTVDLPGHGKSPKSSQPGADYTLKGMAAAIKDFISNYERFEYIIVANSIATNLIAEIAQDIKNCKGLFFTGTCIIGQGYTIGDILQPNPNVAAAFAAHPTETELDLLMDDMAYAIPGGLKQKCKQIFLSADPAFRTTLAESIAAEDWSDEIRNLGNLLVAIVYGEQEKINNVHYLDSSQLKKWKDKILLVPKGGHCLQLDQPGPLAQLIDEFASDCFK